MCEGQVDGSGELVVIGGGEGIAYQRKEKHYSRKKLPEKIHSVLQLLKESESLDLILSAVLLFIFPSDF